MAKKKKKIVRPQPYKKPAPKPMSKKTKMTILAVIGAVVLAILLFALIYDDGSLNVKSGEIKGAEENWLIANLSKSSKEKYYKLGEVDVMEGFVNDPQNSMKSEGDLATDFYMVPETEDVGFDYYYVTGVSSTAEEMANSISGYYQQMASECTPVESYAREDGTEVFYFTANFVVQEDQEGQDSQSLCAYISAEHDASILISISNVLEDGEEPLSVETLVDWMKKIEKTITVEIKE